MNTPRSLPPEPPARGSFPLDHGGQCKDAMRTFLACIKVHKQMHHLCKDESKVYLQCRMDRGLMAPEDLDTLGFRPADAVVADLSPDAPPPVEIIAGLSAARMKKGFMFGLGGGSGDGNRPTRGGGH